MRIGIDASCWLNRRGFGRYTRELVRAMLEIDQKNEDGLFLDATTARNADELPPEAAARVVVATSVAATRAAAAGGSRSPADLWRMRRAVASRGRGLDVFYFPADYTYFPIRTPARVVVTKHDMIDRWFPKLLFANWRSRLFWETKIRLAIHRSDLVFTVSETSRRDIISAFHLSPEDVRVVADAVDPSFVPVPEGRERRAVLERDGIHGGERFILYIGGNQSSQESRHSRVAYQRWRNRLGRRDSPVSLVLVGDYIADVFLSSYHAIRGLVDAAGLGPSVHFTGYVPHADLRHFYSAPRRTRTWVLLRGIRTSRAGSDGMWYRRPRERCGSPSGTGGRRGPAVRPTFA